MYYDNMFSLTLRDIDNNVMYPEDWEDIIYSSEFKDEEVLYLIMYARRKNREYRDRSGKDSI